MSTKKLGYGYDFSVGYPVKNAAIFLKATFGDVSEAIIEVGRKPLDIGVRRRLVMLRDEINKALGDNDATITDTNS